MHRHHVNKTQSLSKSFTGVTNLRCGSPKWRLTTLSLNRIIIEFTKDTSRAGQNIKSNSRSEPTIDLLEAFWVMFVMFGNRLKSDHMEIFEKVNKKKAGLSQYYWIGDEFVLKRVIANLRIKPKISDRKYLIKVEHEKSTPRR